jgi:hypothetical protein
MNVAVRKESGQYPPQVGNPLEGTVLSFTISLFSAIL